MNIRRLFGFAFVVAFAAQLTQVLAYRAFYVAVAIAAVAGLLLCLNRPANARDMAVSMGAPVMLAIYYWLSTLWSIDPDATRFGAAADSIWAVVTPVAFLALRAFGPRKSVGYLRTIPWLICAAFAFALAKYGSLRPEFAPEVRSLGNISVLLLCPCIPWFFWLDGIRPSLSGKAAILASIAVLLLAQSRMGLLVGVITVLASAIWASPLSLARLRQGLFVVAGTAIVIWGVWQLDITRTQLEYGIQRLTGSSFTLEVGTGSELDDRVRKTQYLESMEVAKSDYLLGIGYMAFPKHMQSLYGDPVSAHSVYLQLLAETGIGGLALFCLLIGMGFRNFRAVQRCGRTLEVRRFANAGIIGLAAFALSGFTVQAHQSFVGYLLLAWSVELKGSMRRAQRTGLPAVQSCISAT